MEGGDDVGTYKSAGDFKCDNGGELYYVNSTELLNTETECLSDAKWANQDDVKCVLG